VTDLSAASLQLHLRGLTICAALRCGKLWAMVLQQGSGCLSRAAVFAVFMRRDCFFGSMLKIKDRSALQ